MEWPPKVAQDARTDALIWEIYRVIDTYYNERQAKVIAQMIEAYVNGEQSEVFAQLVDGFFKRAFQVSVKV